MLIRDATPDDLDGILALKLALVRTWFEDEDHLDAYPDYPAHLRERLADLMPRDFHHYWVAEDADGTLVACLSALVTKHLPGPEWSGVHAHLGDLYVVPEHRGEGLAHQLMERAMAWCEAQDAFMADMHATQMAQPMYLKMGWRPPVLEQPGGRFQTLEYFFDGR